MSFPDFKEFQWWYPLVVVITVTLAPLVRALAAVIIGRCLSSKLAELAIPLALRPVLPFRGHGENKKLKFDIDEKV
jgi:hypothetical protein